MTGSRQKVLIVDDQDNWRTLLEEILQEEFEISAVESYPRALREIQDARIPFHVVITDMRLVDLERGNEDGLDLIDYLHRQVTATRTIIVTGYPTFPSQRKAFSKLDVFDYLEKYPSRQSDFDKDELLRIVRAAADEADRCRNNLVFIVMPFDQEFDLFYQYEIKPVIETLGYVCKRADDFYGSRPIMDDIRESIRVARFAVADLSSQNPNVFFEVGIAHALGKDVLLMTQSLNDVPSRLQTVRCLIYERSLSGGTQLSSTLQNAIQEIRNEAGQVFLPRPAPPPDGRRYLAILPGNDAVKQDCNSMILRAMKEANCSGIRLDEIFHSTSILQEVWTHLLETSLVIADLSGRDPDVYYLAGLAYGLGRKIIYLARNESDVTFDLRSGSHILYSLDNYVKALETQKTITRLAREMLGI